MKIWKRVLQRVLQRVENADTTEQAFDIYHKIFVDILNKHVPLKYLTKKQIKIKKKPWLTTGIQKSIKKRRTLFMKIKNMKYKNQNTDEIFNKYKQRRSMINTLKRRSKRDYYFKKYFETNANNSKSTWKGINKLLNDKKNEHKTIFLQNKDGITNDQRKVANKFNEYFINVAGNLSAKIKNKNNKYQDYLKDPNKSNLLMKETTPDEIKEIINNLDVYCFCFLF